MSRHARFNKPAKPPVEEIQEIEEKVIVDPVKKKEKPKTVKRSSTKKK